MRLYGIVLLASPTEAPFLLMCWLGLIYNAVGWFSAKPGWEFQWQWMLAIFFVSGISARLFRIGTLIAVRKYGNGLLNTYFDVKKFRCHEQLHDGKALALQHDLYGRFSNQADSGHEGAIVFRLEKASLKAVRLVQCFPGAARRPALIFLKKDLDELSPVERFEFFHELGHASRHSQDVIALCKIEPIFILIVGTSLACLLGYLGMALGLVYVVTRLIYWFTHRLHIEEEVIADLHALNQFATYEEAETATKAIRKHLADVVEKSKVEKSAVIARRDMKSMRAANVAYMRLGALTLGLKEFESGRVGKLPAFSWNVSIMTVMGNLIVLSVPFLGPEHLTVFVGLLCVELICITIAASQVQDAGAESQRLFLTRLKEIRNA